MTGVWKFDVSQEAGMFHVKISQSGGDYPFHLQRSFATRAELVQLAQSFSGFIDVDATDAKGRSTMYEACEKGYHDMAEFLLDMGASIHFQRTGRYSGSHNGYTALHVAARGGMLDAAKLLLSRGAEAGLCSATGYTPLHLACKYGHCHVAAEILEAGADVNAHTSERRKWTALHFSAEKGHLQTVELLLRRRADVHAVDWLGRTPLHNCSPRVIKLLVSNGAIPTARDASGATPLHRAAARDQVEAVRQLLNYGVAVDATRDDGMTPLHWACEVKSSNAAELLLKMGARVNNAVVSPSVGNGYTALHLAVLPHEKSTLRRSIKLLKLLFEWGADVNARDCRGRTALTMVFELYSGHPYEFSIASVFAKQFATMQVLGFRVNETDLQAMSTRALSNHLKAIQFQLHNMRREKIGESSVTFFDLLTKGQQRLADYAANEDVVRVFKSGKFKTEFPTFAEDIRHKFDAGRERLRLQRESESVLRRGSFRYTPYNVMRRLHRCLTNEDLKQIIKAKD